VKASASASSRFAGRWRQLSTRIQTLPSSTPYTSNPNVQEPVYRILGNRPRLVLLPPLEYVPFVALMQRAELILTDSGGIQEEAPSLRKPVLVMRDTTERPEGVDAGVARLVGTDERRITETVALLLRDRDTYAAWPPAPIRTATAMRRTDRSAGGANSRRPHAAPH